MENTPTWRAPGGLFQAPLSAGRPQSSLRPLAALVRGRKPPTPALPSPSQGLIALPGDSPRRVSSEQKVIVDRKRGQTFPSPEASWTPRQQHRTAKSGEGTPE